MVPWILLTVPSQVFLGYGGLLALTIMTVGVSGNLAGMRVVSSAASISLLSLLIIGKVRTDLIGLPAPDTAVLLLQFVMVIFFMEASLVIISFNRIAGRLSSKTDDSSLVIRQRLDVWVKGQLAKQAQLVVGALGLSLLLIVLGGLTSISLSQLLFSGSLVLVVIGILLFLITQRRESESDRGIL